MTSMTASTVKLDRVHRFAEGDLVHHVDAPEQWMVVTALTLRIRDGVAYPTYTLVLQEDDSEVATDILCTFDLFAV